MIPPRTREEIQAELDKLYEVMWFRERSDNAYFTNGRRDEDKTRAFELEEMLK